MVGFHPSITSTILTMWIVIAVLLLLGFLATRAMKLVPGGLQNLVEFAYENLESFGTSMGGAAAKPYIPLFASFFLLILFCNWVGLIPPVGRIDELRAPTSDVNITLGLALVSFGYFEFQGFRKNGVRGYLGRFFPLYEFRNGIGAGIIALFVGLIELMLEFVKPVTLSMRLFGNIYGGEVALAVITALTLFIAAGPDVQPGSHAQFHPGPDLQHSQPAVHRARGRKPRGRGGRDRRTRRSSPSKKASTAVSSRRPDPAAIESIQETGKWTGRPAGRRRNNRMDHIGAGLAALGVFGPGIGIGILGGLASTAIGRNPEAAGQIRGLAIILAAFAEGLGVLAIVVGILAIFI